MPKYLSKVLLFLLLALGLLACSDATPAEPTPTPLAPAPVIVTTAISIPTPTPIPLQTNETTLAKTALDDFEKANTYRYILRQKVTLPDNSLNAEGTGEYSRPNLQQKLTLTVSGQKQVVDILVLDGVAWQKLENLAVWRKVTDLPKANPNPAALLADRATAANLTNEKLNGTDTRKITLTIPAAIFFDEPSLFGADRLGLLSATGILRGLATKDGKVEFILWVENSSGKLLQRQASLKGNASFSYEALYTYRDFNDSSISVAPPANFPKP
jgi:hypothetical protein